MYKEQINLALGTKYASFGLSKEAVDRIASQVEKTVAKEEDVEASIATFDTMNLIAQEIQKMRDRELRTRSDLQKSFDAYKQSHPETPSIEEQKEEAEPEWAKKLRERFEKQDAEEKRRATVSEITSSLKDAGCNNDEILNLTLRGFSLQEGETVAAAAERLKADYQSSIKKIFGNGPVPNVGSGGFANDEKAFHRALSDFAESKGLGENKN